MEKTIKAIKNFYHEQKFSKCIGDSKQIYIVLNELKGITIINCNVSYFVKDGRRDNAILDVANKLNIFLGIGQKLKEGISNEVVVSLQVNNFMSMWLYEANCNEFLQIIGDFKKKSSSGLDDIRTILIRKTRSFPCKHLVHLVNKTEFFRAKIGPLRMTEAKDEMITCKPNSLLIVWSKNF